MTRPRRIGRRAFLTGTASALAGCRAGPDRPGDVLVLAVKADVTGIYPNPPVLNEAFTAQVNWNVFEGLVGLDPQLRLRPALAAHWSNPDDRTYVFELRPGLEFSDGRPVRAADVVASLRGASRTPLRDYFHAIAETTALDERRLELRTRAPYLVLLTRLPWGLVLPEGEWSRPQAAPIGTGPFRLASWEPGRRLRFETNPRYRGPAPPFRGVVYEVLPGDKERVEAVVSGRADAADHVPLGALGDLERQPGVRVTCREGLRVMYLALRHGQAPFDDPRVREAVDLAVDREELIERALSGRGRVATQLVPATVAGFDPEIRPPRPDLDRARRLLVEAGVTGKEAIELHGSNNRYVNDTVVLEELARQLRRVGLAVETRATDKAAFFRRAGSGGTRLHLMGWSCETADAGDVLDALAHSRDPTGIGSDNDMDLRDARLDRLIDEANGSTSDVQRVGRLKTALARLNALRVYLPLYVQPESVLVSSRVEWDTPPNLALAPAQLRPSLSGPRRAGRERS